MSFSFSPGGRTPAGRDPDLSSEDHYLRKLVNKLDGATQREKKAIFRSVGLEVEKGATREDVIARLKVGAVDFDALVKLAGGERMPGCGAIVPVAVGYRPKAKTDEPRVLDEASAARRLRLLSRLNYYLRSRACEGRQGVKRTWTGFAKALVTMSPGDSQGLIGAVTAGAMTPAQFRDHLSTLSKVIRDDFRKATALGGAKGLEVELCVFHLEQGCLHCHLYFRDVDICDPQRPRLGLFGRTSAGKDVSRERVTLNSLGRSGVALLRHRAAGHEPKLQLFEKTGTLVRDWSVLDVALADRKAKNLGESWDVLLSQRVDQFWAGVFSNPGLKKHRETGHEAWAKDWDEKRKATLKALEEQAGQILKPELEAKDAELEAQKQQTREQRRKTALATSAQIADWLNALRTVVRGDPPPQRFRDFFRRHVSGRRQLVGCIESAEAVVDLLKPTDPSVAVAKDFLSLAQMQKAALDRWVDLGLEQNEAAAEAFLAGEEKKWLASVPAPQPSAEELQAELKAQAEAAAQEKARLEAKLARLEAEKEALVEKLAEAVPVWQEWSSMQLHEAVERIATGQAGGADEFLLDHHGRVSPQVRDRLEILLRSAVPRERADARSALDTVSMHDTRVRKRLFEEHGLSPDGKRPEDDEGEKWKRSGG